MAGTSSGETEHWAPGDHVLWRYRRNGPPPEPGQEDAPAPFHICRPVTVVQDTDELLAVWVAPGTECVKPVLANGADVHAEPLATRYTAPRTTARTSWLGNGVLKLARPGEPWSVWLFWEPVWRFRSWYVNLEAPHTRWEGGVDSEDHFLDISVYPDHSWVWRDEDEFDMAQRAGLMSPRAAQKVRAAGLAAVETIRQWGAPFRDGWEDWRPDPRWQVPVLPDDWDRTPTRMPS
ncbi:cytidylyl-2-hydroxypropylphosphonate hydrolase [Streptomyces sp. NPDC001732]